MQGRYRPGCVRREGTSEAAPEAVGQAVGGGCQSGWGRLLSVTNAIETGTWRQGDSSQALAGHPGGGGGVTPPFQCIPGYRVHPKRAMEYACASMRWAGAAEASLWLSFGLQVVDVASGFVCTVEAYFTIFCLVQCCINYGTRSYAGGDAACALQGFYSTSYTVASLGSVVLALFCSYKILTTRTCVKAGQALGAAVVISLGMLRGVAGGITGEPPAP